MGSLSIYWIVQDLWQCITKTAQVLSILYVRDHQYEMVLVVTATAYGLLHSRYVTYFALVTSHIDLYLLMLKYISLIIFQHLHQIRAKFWAYLFVNSRIDLMHLKHWINLNIQRGRGVIVFFLCLLCTSLPFLLDVRSILTGVQLQLSAAATISLDPESQSGHRKPPTETSSYHMYGEIGKALHIRYPLCWQKLIRLWQGFAAEVRLYMRYQFFYVDVIIYPCPTGNVVL